MFRQVNKCKLPSKTDNPIDFAPIFIFPGIIGLHDCTTLAAELIKLDSNRPIYIYRHPSYSKAEEKIDPATLFAKNFESYVASIAHEINKIIMTNYAELPDAQKSIPFLFIGYSYGANLAEAIAHQIKKDKPSSPTHVVVIDSPATTQLVKFYKSKSAEVTQKLIIILNAAAKLNGLREAEFKEEEVLRMSQKELIISREAGEDSQFNAIFNRIVEQNKETEGNKKLFDKAARVIEHHLHMLYNFDSIPETQIDSLFSWYTKSTSLSYHGEHDKTRNITSVIFKSKELPRDLDHFTCIAKPYVLTLAELVMEFFYDRLKGLRERFEYGYDSDDDELERPFLNIPTDDVLSEYKINLLKSGGFFSEKWLAAAAEQDSQEAGAILDEAEYDTSPHPASLFFLPPNVKLEDIDPTDIHPASFSVKKSKT